MPGSQKKGEKEVQYGRHSVNIYIFFAEKKRETGCSCLLVKLRLRGSIPSRLDEKLPFRIIDITTEPTRNMLNTYILL